MLADKDFEELFTKLDASKSGSISYTEYVAGALDLSLLSNDKILEDAFNFFDKDKSKSIEKKEIRDAFKSGWMSENQLMTLFNEVDTNADQKVQ